MESIESIFLLKAENEAIKIDPKKTMKDLAPGERLKIFAALEDKIREAICWELLFSGPTAFLILSNALKAKFKGLIDISLRFDLDEVLVPAGLVTSVSETLYSLTTLGKQIMEEKKATGKDFLEMLLT